MSKMWDKIALFALAAVAVAMTMSGVAVAQDDDLTLIGPNMAIQKTVLEFSIPENNSLPFAYVEGVIEDHVPDYPVIIQIYDHDDAIPGNSVGAVHFAQTNVNADGSYEYKFRVLDGDTSLYDGQYTVKVFKVVYLNDDTSAA